MFNIDSGTRLKLAISAGIGADFSFNMISTFRESLDDSAFLIAAPLKDGKVFDIDENTMIMLQYDIGSEQFVIAAYKDDEQRIGVRRYWKMRRVSGQRHFYKRADKRYKVVLRCEYWQEDWPADKEGVIECEPALTIDVSAGGCAVYLTRDFSIGEIIKIKLPRIGDSDAGSELSAVANVCWVREAPKGSPMKRVCGLQYRFEDAVDKDIMRAYVDVLQKNYKL